MLCLDSFSFPEYVMYPVTALQKFFKVKWSEVTTVHNIVKRFLEFGESTRPESNIECPKPHIPPTALH